MENSKIQWCDHTFNPWRGCTKVSDGCKLCYAEKQSKRNPAVLGQWGPGKPRVRAAAAAWKQPLKWNRDAEGCAPADRPRVFCASFADWLDDEVPIQWLADLLDLIRQTPNLDWLLLTKRPENWRSRLDAADEILVGRPPDGGKEGEWNDRWNETSSLTDKWLNDSPPPNVWIGTSVENQEWADKRIPQLLKIPAAVRFLSVEPMLGPVELEPVWCGNYESCDGFYPRQLHWVICGGESGGKDSVRPFDIAWGLYLKLQCQTAGIPFFMKQLGDWPVCSNVNLFDFPDEAGFGSWGHFAASAALRLKTPKGGDPDEWPPDLRIRQFPTPVAAV